MATLLYGVAEATLWSSLLIVFVFLIRKPVVRYFGAKWGYALWLLPALKMMIIVTPQTQLSLLPSWQTILYNFKMQQGVYALLQNKKPLTASEALFQQIKAENTARIEAMKTAVMQEERSAFPANRISEQSLLASGSPSSDPVGGWPVFSEIDGMTILFFAWLAGFMVMGLITVGGHARLQKQLLREQREPSKEMRRLIEKLARKMGVKFRGEVLVSARIQAPAVTGWLHPKLVLPLQFAEFYSKQEMEFMLSHELVHLQRRDYLFITWALLLKCIYWFNPLVYLAYPLFRLDQELACDQLVITSVAPQERKSYGLTILKTLSQPEMMFENFQAGCFWFTFSQMKERIAMINHHRNSKGRSMLALISMIVLGFTALTFAASDMVKDPTTGKMVTAPEYGGTITYASRGEPAGPDALVSGPKVLSYVSVVNEKLAIGDWATPRDEWDFTTSYVPFSVLKGQLAESWATPDTLTIVVHIRQGVHWHDKPPMNGRELTAQDIEYNYHRLLGMGSGFTERSEWAAQRFTGVQFESIEATDKWTVVFKLRELSVGALGNILDGLNTWIYPPEVIKEHGDVSDWRNLVGTGPMMLTDWVKGSSWTYTKNPDYWGYDEKYPENRLPYIDQLRALIMPEPATSLAALRTGRIDYMGPIGQTQMRTLDQVESLQRTNPELVILPFAERSDNGLGMNVQLPIFSDIRVRKAMQMAINLEEINNAYFKGYADIVPQGQLSRFMTEVVTPFEEWPEDVKKVFTYDPEGAEALLDEAGYKRGADGIRFKTKLMHIERYDLSYVELVASYWNKIGIDVEIGVEPLASFVARRNQRDFEMSSAEAAGRGDPLGWQYRYMTAAGHNSSNVNDPVYEAMYEAGAAATTLEEQNRIAGELNQYGIEKFWTIFGPVAPQYQATHPWIKGFNGEYHLGRDQHNTLFTRLWIDSALKKEMGH